MANLVTLSRLLLLLLLLTLLLSTGSNTAGACVVIAFFVYMLDALDGYVARKFNCGSRFGAIFDIAVDRVTDISLYFVLAYLHYIPMWIPLVFLIRDHIVDALRYSETSKSKEIFTEKDSLFTKVLISNRYIRTFYAAIKGFSIGFILFDRYISVANPVYWNNWSHFYINFGEVLLYGSVALCLLRALPVIAGFFKTHSPFSARSS